MKKIGIFVGMFLFVVSCGQKEKSSAKEIKIVEEKVNSIENEVKKDIHDLEEKTDQLKEKLKELDNL